MPTIVIADDHAVVRDGLRRILEADGSTVVADVEDGLQVASVVSSTDPDVLLLDLGLPGLHGLDVLREVTKRSPRTKVLVLSGEGRDDFVIGALKSGAAGYLLKSCSAKELVAAVAAVAAGKRFVSAEVSDALVRGLGASGASGDAYDGLTPREREVLRAMADGLSNVDIAARLFISPRTVETHKAKVLRQLGLKTQTEVVLYALKRGLLKIPS